MSKAPLDIRSLARKHTENALATLHSIMMEPKCPPAARVAAAEALLNRGWGKAPQTITGEDGEGPVVVRVERVVINPAIEAVASDGPHTTH